MTQLLSHPQALLNAFLAALSAGDVFLDANGTSAADALCSYDTVLATLPPVATLDDNNAEAGAEDGGLPGGYIAGAVVGSVMGLILIVAVSTHYTKAARRRVH